MRQTKTKVELPLSPYQAYICTVCSANTTNISNMCIGNEKTENFQHSTTIKQINNKHISLEYMIFYGQWRIVFF